MRDTYIMSRLAASGLSMMLHVVNADATGEAETVRQRILADLSCPGTSASVSAKGTQVSTAQTDDHSRCSMPCSDVLQSLA